MKHRISLLIIPLIITLLARFICLSNQAKIAQNSDTSSGVLVQNGQITGLQNDFVIIQSTGYDDCIAYSIYNNSTKEIYDIQLNMFQGSGVLEQNVCEARALLDIATREKCTSENIQQSGSDSCAALGHYQHALKYSVTSVQEDLTATIGFYTVDGGYDSPAEKKFYFTGIIDVANKKAIIQ